MTVSLINMKLYKNDYLVALSKAHEDPEAYKMIESFIEGHFAMVRHLKETTLYDIFEYEKRLEQPLEIFAHENIALKKEVNDLRKKLGMGAKYRTDK